MKIDLVYLWVDGNDKRFCKERDKHLQDWLSKNTHKAAKENIPSRWRDNDELKHSLRSVEKYVPWINHIYIVTFDQTPEWLNLDNPKISVVSHSQMIPPQYLPTFNPNVIEACIPYIPNLSEHFLYANDDMFFGAPLTPEDFFDKNSNPIVYVKHKAHYIDSLSDENFKKVSLKKHVYGKALLLTRKRIYDKFGKAYSIIPCHNIEPFRKSYCFDTIETFKEDFDKMMPHKFRGNYDIEKLVFHLYDFYKGRNTLKLHEDAGKDIVLTDSNLKYLWAIKLFNKFRPVRYNTMDGSHINNKVLVKKPKLFCINDDYNKAEGVNRAYFESLFPKKSQFEK